MKTILILCCLMIAAPLGAAELKANVITLNDVEVQTCRDGGGCVLITKQIVLRLLAAQCAGTQT